jgi:hypothetical protein
VTNEKLKFFGIADKEFALYICITLYFFIFFLKWNCISSVEKEGTIAVGRCPGLTIVLLGARPNGKRLHNRPILWPGQEKKINKETKGQNTAC